MSEVTTRLFTYSDCLEHARDYLGASVANDAMRDARRCVQSAYRNFAAMCNWSYYYTQGRIVTNASYDTGTVVFDYTGGTYERMLTLTDGTWPSWAYLGTVRIGEVDYEVADLKTSTILTLAANSNPGDDVASTSYTLFRDAYPMPIDFQAADEILVSNRQGLLNYVHPSEWLDDQNNMPSPSLPDVYSFMSDPNYYGTMAVRFSPPPDDNYSLDFIYKRRPRPLLIHEYSAGTATITLATDTVAGTGTNWRDNHIGSIIRFSEVAGSLPTGITGDNPFEIQRTIVSVESATAITLDRVVPQTFTNAKYTISDPVDIEDGAMLTGLLREIEKEVRIARRMAPAPEEEMRYNEAILRARENDSRSFARRVGPRATEIFKGPLSDDIGTY